MGARTKRPGRPMTRRPFRWLVGAGVAALVAGVVRLYLIVGVLGRSASCGNAIGYMVGKDNSHPTALAICRGALSSASSEGIELAVAGLCVIVVAVVLSRVRRMYSDARARMASDTGPQAYGAVTDVVTMGSPEDAARTNDELVRGRSKESVRAAN
jgi:hypothetical protein